MARFPDSPSEIPDQIISYVASQLIATESLYSKYNWQGHFIKNNRAEIRQLLGFQTATSSDSEQISNCSAAKILPDEQRFEPLLQLTYQIH